MMRRWTLAGGAALLVGIALLSGSYSRGAAAGPEGPPAGYALAPSFAEEFTVPILDTRRWTNMFADRTPDPKSIAKRTLWGNGELQVYFDPTYLGLGVDPFAIADGVLKITAQPMSPEVHQAVMTDLAMNTPPDQQRSALRNVVYGSGLISTRGGFAQKYGYFEMRARWSAGKGLWPEFWLLPQGGGWPPEIDILEAHGDKPGTAFQSIHSHIAPKAVTRTVSYAGSPQDFHRYGALWLPDRVDWYVDGIKTATMPTPADMTQPMYILVNLAVGGNWPGNPPPDMKWPKSMELDYVRAWRFTTLPPAATK